MLSGKRILAAAVLLAVVVAAFAYGQMDVATKSIRFDLQKIGESIYEAHAKTGKWPMQIADLEGTEYLRMPRRKTVLEEQVYLILWQNDLDPRPEANRDRILAYDNRSLLTRLGVVWACRGDLRVDRLSAEEIAAVKSATRLP